MGDSDQHRNSLDRNITAPRPSFYLADTNERTNNLENRIATAHAPLHYLLKLAIISRIALTANATATPITSYQRDSSNPFAESFSLSNESAHFDHQSRVLRQAQPASNTEIPLLLSSLARPTEQSQTRHACYGHKIIFSNSLLQAELNVLLPAIDTNTFNALITNQGQIDVNQFTAWYQTKGSFSAELISDNQAMLAILLKTISLEQDQLIQQNDQTVRIIYVFGMAEQFMTNKMNPHLSTEISHQSLLNDITQAIQQSLDQDIVMRWYDNQRWSDITQIARISHHGTNDDCRILETFQQKYQHLSDRRLNSINQVLSSKEHQTLRDISLFFEKKLMQTWENAHNLISHVIQVSTKQTGLSEQEREFISLPKLSLLLLENQNDLRRQPTTGPLFQTNFELHQKNFAKGLALFAHTIQHTFGASFLIARVEQSTITLVPDFKQQNYGVLIDNHAISYQAAFDQLFNLSFYLDEITLAKFLYKALYQKIFDPNVLAQLNTLGINQHQTETHLWAWMLHIVVCQEQATPGRWIRVMRLLEEIIQAQNNRINLLNIEDDEGEKRHLTVMQILDPNGPIFAALSRQDFAEKKLLSSLPVLKQEYDTYAQQMAHCTCEVSNDSTGRIARSPQKKKAIKCSEFTEHLANQLKNDPRYLAERDLIPRQEFESIKRYGVEHIEQIRTLPEGREKEEYKARAIEKAQEEFDKIKLDHYSPYKKLREKEIDKKALTPDEDQQLSHHAQHIAQDQQKKINKGIELLNQDFQKAFKQAKRIHPDLQRSDYPELKTIAVNSLKDNRMRANTPLLEIKIPTGGNFAETLSAIAKSILYVESDLLLTYRLSIDGLDSFDFRVMGRKALKNTNDQNWRIEVNNSQKLQTKLVITGLYIGNQAPTYIDIFNDIKPLFSSDQQNLRSDKELAKFILDFMNKGIFSETTLSSWSLSSHQIESIKRGLTQWLLLQTIPEEQRTTGTYAEVKRVLQEYATAENIHDSVLVAIPIKDNPQEKKAPRLSELFNPEKGMFTFMLKGGARLHREQFQSPSQFFQSTFTPESATKKLKDSRQILENLQISPLKSSSQPVITADQVATIKTILDIEQTIQHQNSLQELTHSVQSKIGNKRIYAITPSASNAQANADEPSAKKQMTVITSLGCASSSAVRIKRTACQENIETQAVEISHVLFERNRQAIEFLHNQGKALHAAYEIKDERFTRRTEITDEVAQSGLNAMYAIQTLMDIDKQDGNLQTQPIITVHTYLGWAQIAQGTTQDTNNLINLIQKINNPSLTQAPSLFGRALSKLGTGLQLASVGLDIGEVVTARTANQRALAGTRLFFDSAGLLINSGTLIAEITGLESAAGIFGTVSVPLTGLGIGITALAEQYQAIINDVQQVGHKFDVYQNAYQKGYDLKDNVLFFPNGEVITKIDLTVGKIERGTQYIYPTRYPVAWGYWSIGVKNYNFIPWAGDMPTIERNKERAINLLTTLGWPVEKNVTQYSHVSKLVLPITPTAYLASSYNLCPGATTSLRGSGFDVLNELEKRSPNFAFNFYCFPGEYAIQHLNPEYQATSVHIRLNTNIKQIIVPTIPDILKGKMAYQIEAAPDTQHILRLSEGVSFTLKDALGTQWVIDASSLNNAEIAFDTESIFLNKIKIKGLTPSSQISVIQKNGNLSRIDMQTQTLIPVVINEQTWPARDGLLMQTLDKLNKEHKLGDFVVLDHHQVNGVEVGRAFYETKRNRILYINDHNSRFSKDNIEIIAAHTQNFYIQDISHQVLACVSVDDGHLLQQYHSTPEGQALVRTYTHGNLIFSEWKTGDQESRTYYLDNTQPILSQVNSNNLVQQLNALDRITPEVSALLNQFSLNNERNQWADFVEVTGTYTENRQTVRCRFWIDSENGNVIKPKISSSEPKSCQTAEQENPTSLLAVQRGKDNKSSIFYFGIHPTHPSLSNQMTRKIYVQQGIEQAKHIELPKDSRVDILGDQLFVLHQNQMRQEININGLSSVLEKINLLSAQQTVVVQVENNRNADANQRAAIPAIPGYKTLMINEGKGQTYHIDQTPWNNYANIYINGAPKHIQIDIHENNWLEIKKGDNHCVISDKVKQKSLILTTSNQVTQTNQLSQLSTTTIQIGQRTAWKC